MRRSSPSKGSRSKCLRRRLPKPSLDAVPVQHPEARVVVADSLNLSGENRTTAFRQSSWFTVPGEQIPSHCTVEFCLIPFGETGGCLPPRTKFSGFKLSVGLSGIRSVRSLPHPLDIRKFLLTAGLL